MRQKDMAPGWLHTVSRFNPLTYVVEAERALFSGMAPNSSQYLRFRRGAE